MGALKQLFNWCTADLQTARAAEEFEDLASVCPTFAAYSVPGIVAALQDARSENFDRKDMLLRVIVRLFQEGQFRGLLSTVLILSFAGRLGSLGRRYAAPDNDAELASELVDALLEAVVRYPLQRRPSKLAANLAFETGKRLARSLECRRSQMQAEADAAEELSHLLDDIDSIAAEPIEDAMSLLLDLERRGVIDTTERELVEATIIYGWKLRACVTAGIWASEGLTYKAAYHRLTRALKRIKNDIALFDESDRTRSTRKKIEKSEERGGDF